MPAPVVQILEAADYNQQVRRGADLLAAGKIVVLPTETVYGAAALLTEPAGRDRLRALRNGAPSRPLTPHLAKSRQAEEFLGEIGDLARRMMRKLWPGPVGLQFEVPPARQQQVALKLGLIESDLYDQTWITLRCPDHRVFTDVASSLDGVLALTLAGEPGPFDAANLAADLDGKVDLIFDAGQPRFSKPSTLIKVGARDYQIVRSGVYDERTIRRLLKMTILFVCSGNTCRSPMAEAIARRVLAEQLGVDQAGLEKRGIEIISAGSSALAGSRATPEAVEAVKTVGADLSRHRSQPLTIELINRADVIYAMGRGHGRAVLSLVPSAEEKVKPLNPAADIEDPIGGNVELYNDLAGELQALIASRLREQTLA